MISYVQSDGQVAAVSFNLDGTVIRSVVTDTGSQPAVAVGNFSNANTFVLTFLNSAGQIKTATYQANGTLLSQGEGGKSSHLTVIATDILSNFPGDEYVTSFIQEDGRVGLLGFAADNRLLGKVLGDFSHQPKVKAGLFPQVGLVASLIQAVQIPTILFLDNQGKLLAKGAGGATATVSTHIVADIDKDGIDEGILVDINEAGLLRFEVFGANGEKK